MIALFLACPWSILYISGRHLEVFQGKKRKAYPVTRCNAYMAANAGFVTSADYAKYHQAMKDPDTAAYYDQLAKVMTLARLGGSSAGGHRRKRARRQDPLQAALRRRRANAQRLGAKWDARTARQQLSTERSQLFWQEWERRRRAAKQASFHHHARNKALEDALIEHATRRSVMAGRVADSHASPLSGAPAAASTWAPGSTIPVPLRAPAVAGPRQQAFATLWAPDVQGQVMAKLPAVLQKGAQAHQLNWEASHSTMTGQGVAIRPATAAQRRARLCWEAGRCLCRPAGGPIRGMQVAFCNCMVAWMGPGSRKSGISERRRLVEEAFVVARVFQTGGQMGESHWWHVALMYFDPVRPTLMLLAACQTPAGNSVELTAKRSLSKSYPRWRTIWAALEGLEPARAWSVEWWRITAADTQQGTWQATAVRFEDAEPQQFWAGAEAEALWRHAAESDSASDVASDSGHDSEASSQRQRRHRRARAQGPQRAASAPAAPKPAAAPPPETSAMAPIRPEPELGDPVEAAVAMRTADQADEQHDLAERVKRSPRGEKTALHARTGEVLEVLWTYRRPGKGTPFGGFQATCYHHPSDRLTNKAGRPYSLACRKSTKVAAHGGEAAALLKLSRWVRSAPQFSTRLEHQAMAMPDSGESSPEDTGRKGTTDSSSDSDSSTSSSSSGGGGAGGAGDAGNSHDLKHADGPKAGQGPGHATDVGPTQPGPPDPAAPRAAAGPRSPADRPAATAPRGLADSQAVADARPANSPGCACWVCGEAHRDAQCPLWMLAINSSLAAQRQPPSRQPRMPRGCLVPRELVCCKDVPGDGDCLFHAIGLEIRNAFKGAQYPPNTEGSAPGAGWRAFFLQFASENPEFPVGDFTVEEIVRACQGCSVEEYCRSMQSRANWGGFLEASILCHAWGQNLAIGILASAEGDWHVLAWVGPTGPNVTPIYIVWLGDHWQRARLRAAGARLVRAWRLEAGGGAPPRSNQARRPTAPLPG